ncbi:MAG: DUF1348 family protein [Streptosporangiaceae bacterium]
MAPRPPLPPFTEQTARQKVQAAEDAWNTRDPERVAGAYELWEFDEDGYMMRREASINDVPIDESQRRIFGPRPEEERGQSFPLH